MQGGGHGRLRPTGIQHEDFRLPPIAQDSLPKNGMGHRGIRPHEHQTVRLLEIGIRVGRRVEAQTLLVGDMRRGHALTRVGIAMQTTHPELEERPQQRHLLSANLAGAQEGDGVRPPLLLHRFHP